MSWRWLWLLPLLLLTLLASLPASLLDSLREWLPPGAVEVIYP